jgi:hypothetical protein
LRRADIPTHTICARALRQSRVPLWRSLLYYLLTESHVQPVWCFSFSFSTRVGQLIFCWRSSWPHTSKHWRTRAHASKACAHVTSRTHTHTHIHTHTHKHTHTYTHATHTQHTQHTHTHTHTQHRRQAAGSRTAPPPYLSSYRRLHVYVHRSSDASRMSPDQFNQSLATTHSADGALTVSDSPQRNATQRNCID